MRVASFFSGIGGFDLGFERAGMQVVFQCEMDGRRGRLIGNAVVPAIAEWIGRQIIDISNFER